MKARFFAGLGLFLLSAVVSAQAQPSPPGGAPGAGFDSVLAKLFGENSSFSATLEQQIKLAANGESMTIQGKMVCADGKFRFETDMSKMAGSRMAGAAEQMRSMGLAKMIMLNRPDKKVGYMVFPDLQAYVERPVFDPEAMKPASEFKLETTELGKEDVDGHPCVKTKAVVTDTQGQKHESTMWNATDLHKFPIKIELALNSQGVVSSTMMFKNIDLTKPDASVFDPPSGFTKYDSQMAMMQNVMMKRMGQPKPAAPGQP
jgi:hypothetical protein